MNNLEKEVNYSLSKNPLRKRCKYLKRQYFSDIIGRKSEKQPVENEHKIRRCLLPEKSHFSKDYPLCEHIRNCSITLPDKKKIYFCNKPPSKTIQLYERAREKAKGIAKEIAEKGREKLPSKKSIEHLIYSIEEGFKRLYKGKEKKEYQSTNNILKQMKEKVTKNNKS